MPSEWAQYSSSNEKAALWAAFSFEGEIVNPARRTRRRAGFYWNCSRCARILPKAFYFGAGLHVSGIARLRGSRACSADGQQDCRCAVRRVGDVGAVSRSALARGGAASLRGCAVRLRPSGRLSFPFEQQRFCALAKTLDASCAHQEGVQPPSNRGNVRRKKGAADAAAAPYII